MSSTRALGPFRFDTQRLKEEWLSNARRDSIAALAVALAMVGIIESLLTASVVDELTDTRSCKHKEAKGQGIANIVAGFFGGMAGCAMIGQSVINVQSGGRGRLSTFLAGVYLIVLILVFGEWVARIPMGALVAVMFAVSFGTFDWSSLKNLRRAPIPDTLVMVVTVATVVMTNDLALGVMVGVILNALMFSRSVAKLVRVTATFNRAGERTYVVTGDLFFASVEAFMESFDFYEETPLVEIDLTHAHVWDSTAVEAIDRAVARFGGRDVKVRIIGLNEASANLVERLGARDRARAALAAGG